MTAARKFYPEASMTPPPTTAVKGTIAAIAGSLTALEFGPEKALISLVVLHFLDWITGLAVARRRRIKWTSDRAMQGAFKKGMMWVYVSVASIGVWLAPIDTSTARTALTAVLCGFAWVEVLSIAENGNNLGWPMPSFMKSAISWLEPKDPETRIR